MPLETGTYLNALVAANPAHDDQLSAADSHIRLLKAVLLATFPNLNAAVTATPADLNGVASTFVAQSTENTRLENLIAAEVTNRNTAVTNEATTRAAQDAFGIAHTDTNVTALSASITAEANTRSAQDVNLQNEINGINATIPTLMPFGSISFGQAGNGYYARIPNGSSTGFIIQAGYSGALATGNGDGVSFPVPFPNAVAGVIVSNATPGNLTVAGTLPGGTAAASGFLAYAKTASTGTAAPGAAVYFIAMGF